jgi:hypothetical protein
MAFSIEEAPCGSTGFFTGSPSGVKSSHRGFHAEVSLPDTPEESLEPCIPEIPHCISQVSLHSSSRSWFISFSDGDMDSFMLLDGFLWSSLDPQCGFPSLEEESRERIQEQC